MPNEYFWLWLVLYTNNLLQLVYYTLVTQLALVHILI